MANLRLLVLLLVVAVSFDAALGACRSRPRMGPGCESLKCEDEDEFVCGSDGLTYQNICFLEQARCETQMGIKEAHEGYCTSALQVEQCPDDCDGVPDNFVCDQDGHRHRNICEFKMDNCGAQKREVYHTNNKHCRRFSSYKKFFPVRY